MNMFEVRATAQFSKWLKSLKDRRARARIVARIDAVEMGHFGDVAPVGEGVSELRLFYGPGYRIYFMKKATVVIILLIGGDKSTQKTDIAKAKTIAGKLRE